MMRKVPLIVILGSTGTGKTKLSVELAQKFGGDVISADSMQVYADLDIVTAKATKEEQQTVPHHLLDVAKPSEPFTVKHFRNLAGPIVSFSNTSGIGLGSNFHEILYLGNEDSKFVLSSVDMACVPAQSFESFQ
ncbi:unnamed protein product [Hermetia illucens]|uniref:Isopentenyltransferase n=1 Tax=Hermetia illucens TaxID=343691 RepID=A0A7R8Z1Z2_HERIL|nr:unnamed protein product [Hermetia illucens]